MPERLAIAARTSTATALRFMAAPLLVLLLFGDYLILSVSHHATGSVGGWLACVAVLQLMLLPLLVLLGDLRREIFTTPVVMALLFGLVLAGHLLWRMVQGDPLDDYAVQKTLAWFGLCIPGLLIGLALGRHAELPGVTGFWPVFGLLLALCLVAVATDPALLTILYVNKMAVLFGLLVLPAHQALAYCMTKGCLYCFAITTNTGRSSWRGRLGAAGVVLALGLVAMSGARTYLVGAVAAIGVLLLFARHRIGLGVVAVGVGGYLLQGFGSSELHERLDPNAAFESVSFLERLDVWQMAIRAFLEQPLFGQGPGGFATYCGWYTRAYPHNLPLEILAEAGIVGGACLLVLLLVVARGTLRLWKAKTVLDPVQIFAIGLLTFSLVGGLGVGDLIRNHFLFFAIGLVLSSTRRVQQGVRPKSRGPRSNLPTVVLQAAARNKAAMKTRVTAHTPARALTPITRGPG